MFKFTGIIMNYAPIGIAAQRFYVVGQSGLGVLWNLGKLVLTLYSCVCRIYSGCPDIALVAHPTSALYPCVAVIAFTSFPAKWHCHLRCRTWKNFGVPQRIVSFVLPTGYSFNLDGSTLYLGSLPLSLWRKAVWELSFRNANDAALDYQFGTAVARVPLVILSGTLVQFGLPLERYCHYSRRRCVHGYGADDRQFDW